MNRSYLLFIVLVFVVVLFFFGPQLGEKYSRLTQPEKAINIEKFDEIVDYISSYYIDKVPWDTTMMGAIEGLLTGLDPHSVYIPVRDVVINEENFQGKYQGIGIQFDVIDGYLTVIAPIPGSPSDELGLMSGDQIIKINDESVIGISSRDVTKKLKGPKGTSVDITVKRNGLVDPLEYTIVRDEIPILTVETYFVSEDGTGYLFLNRFAKTTEAEVEEALEALEEQGMKRLILDLRGNAGGYLDQAVKIAAKFIEGRKKIVYTKGRLPEFNEEYYTDSFGTRKVRTIPLVVLINQGSASAAEIVAGAIQDYDRGFLIGNTSFGKGLVQREFPLSDDSRIRLTISKYYTPSGRLIQRPYKGKKIDQYYRDSFDSLDIAVLDDDPKDRPIYYTVAGRKVYGGGGIEPDTIITYSSLLKPTNMLRQFLEKKIFFEVAANFAARNQDLKNSYENFLVNFKADDTLIKQIKLHALEKEIEVNSNELNLNIDYIDLRIKAEIARSLWGTEKYQRIMLTEDNQYNAALKFFPKAEKMLLSYLERK